MPPKKSNSLRRSNLKPRAHDDWERNWAQPWSKAGSTGYDRALVKRRGKVLLQSNSALPPDQYVLRRCDGRENPKAKYGHSRDKRTDCLQLVIALVITTDGFPLAYEVLDGNTSDRTTLRDFLDHIEKPY